MENKKLEQEISKLQEANKGIRLTEHPVIKTILNGLNMIPVIDSGVGTIGTGVDTYVNNYLKVEQEKRLVQVCEIIISDNNITTDMVQGVKEIMSFAKMFDVVRKLITNDKLNFIVKLYKNLIIQDERNYNEFEEYLRRLDELSFRELEILYELDTLDLIIEDLRIKDQDENGSFDEEYYHSHVKEIESKWKEFQSIVEQKFKIDSLDLEGYMLGISRTGFCVKFNAFHMPIKTNSIYAVTKYYRNFANMIY